MLVHLLEIDFETLLKYSLFLSSTPVLTSSIDVVFVLSMSSKYGMESAYIVVESFDFS